MYKNFEENKPQQPRATLNQPKLLTEQLLILASDSGTVRAVKLKTKKYQCETQFQVNRLQSLEILQITGFDLSYINTKIGWTLPVEKGCT